MLEKRYEYDFCEYAVTKKKEGVYLAAIVLTLVAALIFVVGFFFVILPAVGGVPALLIFSAVCLLLWYGSRFASIEYEYTQTDDILDFAAIYSAKYRKEKASVELKKCGRSIAPYKGGQIEGGFRVTSTMDLRSSRTSPCGYALIYEDGGATKAILFDANRRLIENLRHQVPSIVVPSDRLPD